jgi:hypothetical protein
MRRARLIVRLQQPVDGSHHGIAVAIEGDDGARSSCLNDRSVYVSGPRANCRRRKPRISNGSVGVSIGSERLAPALFLVTAVSVLRITNVQSRRVEEAGPEAPDARSPSPRTNRVRATLTRYTSSRLALTPGTRLGVYDITAQIAVGNMVDVFRTTDTKLNREVAIKFLPSS